MKSRLDVALVLGLSFAAFGVAACAADSGGPNDPGSVSPDAVDGDPAVEGAAASDVTPPAVLSITPADGTKKLTDDVNIVITFSEPMAKAATLAAFSIDPSSKTSGPPSASWNAEGTVLTIDPKAAYASGTDPATVTSAPLKFSLSTAATDLAGNSLTAGANVSVSLYRQIEQVAPLHASLFGNTYGVSGTKRYTYLGAGGTNDLEARGYASFVLTDLPDDIHITKATLVSSIRATGTAFTSFGDMRIEHISFDAVGPAAWSAPALHDLGVLVPATPAPNVDDSVEKDVTVAVTDDYALRTERNNLSQYRLRFLMDATKVDGVGDLAHIHNSQDKTKLVVRYLIE